MKSRHRTIIRFIALVALLLPIVKANAQSNNLEQLRSIFTKENRATTPPWELKPILQAFDMGETALPLLKDFLIKSNNENKTYWATHSIATIGGKKAIDIIRGAYKKTKSSLLKSFLCFTLASTGSKEDIEFLIQALQGEHIGDEWPPIQQAAYSLGVLRAKKARSELEHTAKKKPGTFASDAASDALKWIDGDMWETPQIENTIESDEVILAMIRFGIPRLSESTTFYEKTSKRVWKRKEKTWSYEAQQELSTDTLPSISFSVHIAPDRVRAICSVGLHFGPLNGSGYEFIMKKIDGAWKVVGVMQTWIS